MIFVIASAIFAVLAYSCCVVAGKEDERIYADDKKHSGLLEEDE